PLVTPGETPEGGAVGMQHPAPAVESASPAPVMPAPVEGSSQPVALGGDDATQPQPLPAPAEPALPPVTAAGDYVVGFGSFATPAAADAVVAALRASQLPARREAATVAGKSAWRVRIGPYATRPEAEIARLRASHVRDDVDARVVVLDAPTPVSTPASQAPASAPVALPPATVAASVPAASVPAASAPPVSASTGFAVQLAAYSKSSEAAALRDRLRAAGFAAFTESVDTDKGSLTRVRVGPVITRADADQLKAQVKAKLGLDGVVRPHP
ncbi:MAG: SPOR domain-containing protein, partial [Luteimonas sp.]